MEETQKKIIAAALDEHGGNVRAARDAVKQAYNDLLGDADHIRRQVEEHRTWE